MKNNKENYKWAKDFACANSLSDLKVQQAKDVDFNKVVDLVSKDKKIPYRIGRLEETCEDCLIKQLNKG